MSINVGKLPPRQLGRCWSSSFHIVSQLGQIAVEILGKMCGTCSNRTLAEVIE